MNPPSADFFIVTFIIQNRYQVNNNYETSMPKCLSLKGDDNSEQHVTLKKNKTDT